MRHHFALDCEYIRSEDRLLSIALAPIYPVRQIPRFYRVIDPIPAADSVDPWIAEHVLPHLSDPVPYAQAQQELGDFLREFKVTDIWVDWPDDLRYFSNLLITGPGERLEFDPAVMYDNPLIGSLRFHYVPGLPDEKIESKRPHHALSDAVALANFFKFTPQLRAAK